MRKGCVWAVAILSVVRSSLWSSGFNDHNLAREGTSYRLPSFLGKGGNFIGCDVSRSFVGPATRDVVEELFAVGSARSSCTFVWIFVLIHPSIVSLPAGKFVLRSLGITRNEQ